MTSKELKRRDEITQKLVFARAYVMNGGDVESAAMIAFDASEREALRKGIAMRNDPQVAEEIDLLTEYIKPNVEVMHSRMLVELARIALSDIRNALDPETGAILPPKSWDDRAAAAIESLTQKASGDLTLKVANKTRAIEMYMRHLGMFKEDNEQQVPDPVADLLSYLSNGGSKPLPAIAND